MSHFSVMVIGSDTEAQLAPFHEYECTGVKDEFVVPVDFTDELREHMASVAPHTLTNTLEWCGLSNQVYTNEEEAISEQKFNYVITNDKGELVKAVRFTNPNAKWDCWSLCGRWGGMYPLKPGGVSIQETERSTFGSRSRTGYSDKALKKDIDFLRMEDLARNKGAALYDSYIAALTPDLIASFVTEPTWEEVNTKNPNLSAKERRHIYHGGVRQIVRERLTVTGVVDGPFWNSEDAQDMLRKTRLEFAEYEATHAWVPYACVHERTWIARGEMGWFGCSSPTGTYEDYVAKVRELVLSLPDDAVIANVDCHI